MTTPRPALSLLFTNDYTNTIVTQNKKVEIWMMMRRNFWYEFALWQEYDMVQTIIRWLRIMRGYGRNRNQYNLKWALILKSHFNYR